MERIKSFYKLHPVWFWTIAVMGCVAPRAFVVFCIGYAVHEVMED